MEDKNKKSEDRTEVFLENNSKYLEYIRRSKRNGYFAFLTSPRLRSLYSDYLKAETDEEKLDKCTKVLNEYDNCLLSRLRIKVNNVYDNIRILKKQIGRRSTIDRSDKKVKDYYSVLVMVKNEARYIREFVLFYQATGADRIYIYDNESTDNLLEELEPFISSGLVVYRYWPGKAVQTEGYRDAVRRTKKRTKWLAIIDADEFLFSPRGKMPEQLKDYEDYPGVGANWLLFGPNGHDRRPEGLVMDNYTATFANYNHPLNSHIKSIVQPKEVLAIRHPHYPIYKKGRFAVDEKKEIIDNRNALGYHSGRAFTAENRKEIFRINHYHTKSLEELKEKCERGYADGTLKADYEEKLGFYRGEEMVIDLAIRRYSDLIRDKM